MESQDIYFDQLAAYVAGGLTADGRRALEAHLAACPTCAAELRSIQAMEESMNAAMSGFVPSADFENRLIHRLRNAPTKRRWMPRGVRVHPVVRRAALAAAAMIMLGGAGFVGSTWIETGKMPTLLTDARSGRWDDRLKQLGNALSYNYQNPFPSSGTVGSGFKLNNSIRSEFAVAGDAATPQSEEKGWNFGGGTAATTWWERRAGFDSKSAAGNQDRDGQDVLYGDGHVEPATRAPTGVQEDNRDASRRSSGPISNGISSEDLSEAADASGNLKNKEALNYRFRNAGADADGDGIADSGVTGLPALGRETTRTHSVVPFFDSSGVQKGVSTNFGLAFKPGEFGNSAGKPVVVANGGTLVLGGQVLNSPGSGAAGYAFQPSRGQQTAGNEKQEYRAFDGPAIVQATNRGEPGAAQSDAAQQVAPQPAEQVKPAANQQKIIRNGDMEFEVDSFDKSFATVTAIVVEEGGYVGSTNSDKLPNGKVKGTVVVRVPAERLDTLVLKLRALGDLKSQRITAQDITKEYTDLQSELRAGRAMEERLLAIIKDGKGEIKDLLAAEKELAVWRGKIEKVQGQINYYNNQVSLSTLNLTITERNIETAASATEREEVNVGIEADDVDAARARALKEFADAKGRIVTSELKQMDAGQLAAKIVVDVPPDASGPLLDVLKQLGKVARFDLNRQLTTPDNQPPKAPTRVERKETRIVLSLYNIVTVQPRVMTNIDLAVDDVEATYKTILDGVAKVGGRVVSNNLARQSPTNVSGQVWLEIKAADAEKVLNDLKALGAATRLTVSESQDTANTTTAKRGVVVSLVPTLNVPARQTTSLGVEVGDVEGSLAKVQSAAISAGARLSEGNLSRDTAGRTSARVVIDLSMAKSEALRREIESVGKLRAVQSSTNSQAPEGPAARARIELTLATGDAIVAGETGLWSTIRSGLSTSVAGLLWSLRLIVIGVCFVGPWVLLIWGIWKLLRRKPVAAGVGNV